MNLDADFDEIDGSWAAQIQCKDAGCADMLGPLSEHLHDYRQDAVDDAIARWNRRAPAVTTPVVEDERPWLRAQIAAMTTLLEGRTREKDPIGFLQFTARIERFQQKLAQLEAAAASERVSNG
jgi:hypothetical protein